MVCAFVINTISKLGVHLWLEIKLKAITLSCGYFSSNEFVILVVHMVAFKKNSLDDVLLKDAN